MSVVGKHIITVTHIQPSFLPSSPLFSNSSSNIYSFSQCKGSRETRWEAVLQGEWGRQECAGVVLALKLKYEHIHLNSFSEMRVDLAAQVNFHIQTYDWHSSTSILVYTIGTQLLSGYISVSQMVEKLMNSNNGRVFWWKIVKNFKAQDKPQASPILCFA